MSGVTRTFAPSDDAARALQLVQSLQSRFAAGLESVAADAGTPTALQRHEWLRDGGRHGGGDRLGTHGGIFNRASINVSQVHYSDMPQKPLASANALSTIIHPTHPRAPSVHIHISWTKLREGRGYWRMMADLNPAIPIEADRARFAEALKAVAPQQYASASEQGDRYFYIPALQRHRGVTHFYLEDYATDEPEADAALAEAVGRTAIDTYLRILRDAVVDAPPPTDDDRAAQLRYHTVYLFQVLTLDRGTSSGLLVHADNDLGIMGSLPSHVDRALLASWRDRVDAPYEALVDGLVAALPDESPAPVTDDAKVALAQAVRDFFRAHPEALRQQASGGIAVPTVANHK